MEIFRADSEADRDAVFRFRYSVYVEEMGRYLGMADHDRRMLIEPEDAHSYLYGAREGPEVVATCRTTFGADGFSARQMEQYSLQPFLDQVPDRLMAIGERLMVAPDLRGSSLGAEIRALQGEDITSRGVRIVFGDCEPHLLSLYLGMGCRTYAERNINSAEAGYLIPIISFIEAETLAEAITADPGGTLPDVIQRAMAGLGGVTASAVLAPDEYWAQVSDQLARLAEADLHAFSGFDDVEVKECVSRSNMLRCAAGDRLLKKEGSSHNLFVVLSGTLEVREGRAVVGVLGSGDVFGEMAFLLGVPRQRDVFAASDDVSVLSLSEGTLRKLISEEPELAAKLLLNISRMLCGRLIRTTDLAV